VQPTRLVAVLLILLGSVLAITHAGAALIVAGAFRPSLAVALGLVITSLGYAGARRFAWPPASEDPAPAAAPVPQRTRAAVTGAVPGAAARDLVLLLAVALVLRLAPLPNLAGGRDDGVYTAIGAHLSRHPSPSHTDPTLVAPPRDVRDLYDRVATTPVLRYARDLPPQKQGRYEGNYLPGVYLADAADGTLVFQFPHGLPIWLAITGAVLGTAHLSAAVVGFGLLGVGLLYLLVLALTRARGWALVGGLLLAVNPLHAFFSRNTLSEVVALAFLLAALLLAAWAWRLAASVRQRAVLAALAVLAYSAYCLTRIDGFFFLPFAVVAAADLVSREPDAPVRRTVLGALVGLVLVYAASVAYLWQTSFPYALEQYAKIFGPLLGPRWPQLLPWLLGAAALLTAALLADLWRGGLLSRPFARLRSWLGAAVVAVLALAVAVHALKVVRLATGEVADQIGYVASYDLAGHGWQSVKHSSLVNAAIYLSPPLALLLAVVLLRVRDRDPVRTLLLLLLAGPLVYAAVLQWVLPYQYYYGRYLLSAVVPLAILVTVCELARRPGPRPLTTPLVVLAVATSAVLATTQLRYQRYDGLAAGLAETVAGTGTEDLILWDTETCGRLVAQTPLIYVHDRNVWTFAGREALVDLLAQEDLLAPYADVWVCARLNYLPRRLQAVDEVAFEWAVVDRAPILPRGERRERLAFTRFRVGDAATAGGPERIFFDRGAGSTWLVEGFHPGLAWTTGRFTVCFDVARTDHRQLDLVLQGWRPAAAEDLLASARLVLNGTPLALAKAERTLLSAPLPPGILAHEGDTLTVEVDTFVPAELDPRSGDRRALGLDIDAITLR